jgi:Xaa-Pro aminopeptidase
MGKHFTDESFCTIAGWKGNGAIVHYHAEPEQCATIDGNGVLLLDSGWQYLDGTTDITRTVWIGDEKAIPEAVKHDFTLVLKGHIALANARFPQGTRGNQLDVLAHQFMWQEGITYGHGTGHGVGHFMGCHEGPANIRTDNNTNPIKLGNIFSDEPGIYRTNEYGIRTENLVVTVPVSPTKHTTGENYYQFETITLCFYDKRLMDLSMLTRDEIEWVNAYHAKVYAAIADRLSTEEAAYLAEKCHPIG